MRGAYVDDVRIIADTVVQAIETNLCQCLTFIKQRVQLFHSNRIILCIIKCDVANLMRS